MDKILGMMDRWNPIGQWLFLLFIVMIVFATVNNLFRLTVVFFRGWPVCGCQLKFAEEVGDEKEE